MKIVKPTPPPRNHVYPHKLQRTLLSRASPQPRAPRITKKSSFSVIFLFTFVWNMLKYPCVSLSLRGQQANINRQQAIDIAENRTFSYQQIHPKKHRYWMVNNYQLRTMNYKLSTTVLCRLSSVVCPLSSALYICREPSTNQLFYAKQTQFPKSQMNVSIYSQMEYENKCDWTLGESKPNSNPIKPNLQKAQMNVNSLITKDYRKNDDLAVRKKQTQTNPISNGGAC